MQSKYNKLTCLFGHHDYSEEETRDTYGYHVHLCNICKRSGYIKWYSGNESWYDYDAIGNRIHMKWSDGTEAWFEYDEEGNCLYEKWGDGTERWHTGRGYQGI